jgi:hypothetical protein
VSGQQHAPAALYPRWRLGSHWTGGWVGPRAGLDGPKISTPPGFDPRTVQPVVSRYTDWANYQSAPCHNPENFFFHHNLEKCNGLLSSFINYWLFLNYISFAALYHKCCESTNWEECRRKLSWPLEALIHQLASKSVCLVSNREDRYFLNTKSAKQSNAILNRLYSFLLCPPSLFTPLFFILPFY